MDNWRDYLLPLTATLEDVVTVLEQNQCAVIVDENNRLAGTLTDRDVRSALLKHMSLQSPVSQSMNTDPTYLSQPLDISHARAVIIKQVTNNILSLMMKSCMWDIHCKRNSQYKAA